MASATGLTCFTAIQDCNEVKHTNSSKNHAVKHTTYLYLLLNCRYIQNYFVILFRFSVSEFSCTIVKMVHLRALKIAKELTNARCLHTASVNAHNLTGDALIDDTPV